MCAACHLLNDTLLLTFVTSTNSPHVFVITNIFRIQNVNQTRAVTYERATCSASIFDLHAEWLLSNGSRDR